MAQVAQSHIDFLKGLENITVGKSSAGFFSVFSNGQEQSISNTAFKEKDIISRTFGQDFYDQLTSGNFDSLMNEGILSGSFGEEGFSIDLALQGELDTETLGPLPDTQLDPVDQLNSQLETGTTDVSGGSSPTSTTGSTTNTGSSSGGGALNLSTGTGSAIDQQLQTQSQLLGQQAFNVQQQNQGLLDGLQSQTTELQNIGDVLSSLFSSNFGNEDFGLGANFSRQNALKRAGRGTASTKVHDKNSQQAMLQQPTLLKG